MRVAVPQEIKPAERRVGLVPAGVTQLVRDGHEVLVETGAGEGSGFDDDAYAAAGAEVVDRRTVWEQAELLVDRKSVV